MSLYQIKGLTYCYPPGSNPALKEVSLNLGEGEFVLLLGGSGGGKSSLLRLLGGLIPDFYGGFIEGDAFFRGQKLLGWKRPSLAQEVGMVFQDPEKQLILRNIEREIAFGLENLGIDFVEMRRRVAEVVDFFGLSELKIKTAQELSGGEKQKVVLASIMAMQPRVLLLDEPTSQLDPAAAEEILNLIKRLNEEMGITVVLVEQRLERCYHLADRVIVMEKGAVAADGAPDEVICWMAERLNPLMPPVARFFAHLRQPGIPLTVKQGRDCLRRMGLLDGERITADSRPRKKSDRGRIRPADEEKAKEPGAVRVKNVWFSYNDGQEALKGLNLRINAGEFVAIMGPNGAGKSTLLRHMAALLRPGRGRVEVLGKDLSGHHPAEVAHWLGYLSQNPNHYLLHDTVEEELIFNMKNLGINDEKRMEEMLRRLDLSRHRKANPRDLSAGERQRVALASVMISRPSVLVLDEPTRGMDWLLKLELGRLLLDIRAEGIAVVLVTHDIEFVAEYAERVVLMYRGSIVADGGKCDVLSRGMFYSPQVNRLFQGIDDRVVSFVDAKRCMEVMGYGT